MRDIVIDWDPDKEQRDVFWPFLDRREEVSLDALPDRSFAIRVWSLRDAANEDYRGNYLRTEHWTQVRLRALRRAGFQCACGDWATDAHHDSYRFLGCEAPEDVRAVCRPCHDRFHQTWEHVSRAQLARQLSP